jgi:hypothetical protein
MWLMYRASNLAAALAGVSSSAITFGHMIDPEIER